MLIAAFFLGCSAERLAVTLPPVGAESVDAADLQKDIWAQLRQRPLMGSEEWLKLRFEHHDAVLEVYGEGQFCARQSSPIHTFTVAPTRTTQSPYWIAILLSLAKGLEHESTGQFCVGKYLSDASVINLNAELSQEVWPEGASPEEKFSEINYQLLAQKVRVLLGRLE